MSHAPWDTVVVGAGPAGCIAAASLARAGARVLLVERARLPRDKVCGCCLGAPGVAALQSMGVVPALERMGARSFASIRIRCGERGAEFGVAPGLALSRRTLDESLCEHAERSGAQLRDGTSATVTPAKDHARVTLSWKGGEEHVTARTVVIADGLGGSSLRNHPGFGWKVRAHSRMGVGALVDTGVVPLAPGQVHMHVGAIGYVGMVRIEGSTVDVAAAIDPAALRAGGPGAAVATILESCGVESGWAASVRWHGTPPLTRRRDRVALGGVFVVGDAAGYVEPFTGEGMTWAIRGGAAVGACCQAFLAGDPSASARWEAEYGRIIRSRQAACRALSWLVRRPLLVRAGVALAAGVPAVSKVVPWVLGTGGVDRCGVGVGGGGAEVPQWTP